MRLSWQGVVLAPLVVPLILAALLTLGSPGQSPLWGFAFFVVVGSFISYGATIFLLLPCLFLVSRIVMLRWHWICLCGVVLGGRHLLPHGLDQLPLQRPRLWSAHGHVHGVSLAQPR
jgi:hypothetical protein